MIYIILKWIVRQGFYFLYRKIYFSGIQKIPQNHPVILVCNHPSGFIEPCLLACFLPAHLYFLARGDLFAIPYLRWLLVATHQIPIFRFKDGFSGLRSNQESIQTSVRILAENKNLLIFPEGGTKMVRKIRPLQKGVARIIFAAYESGMDKEIYIVPVGFNLSHMRRFRSDVAINIGDPIPTKHLYEKYPENQGEAARILTDEMEKAMKLLVPHITKETDEALLDDLVRLMWDRKLPDSWYPVFKENSDYPYSLLSRLARKINSLNQETKSELQQKAYSLRKELNKNSILWNHIDGSQQAIPFRKIFFTLGWILALPGLLLNIIPYLAGKFIADRFVGKGEFYISVAMTSILVLYYIFYFSGVILILLLSPVWIFPWLLIPVFGYISILYWENYIWLKSVRQWKRQNPFEKRKLQTLVNEIRSILS